MRKTMKALVFPETWEVELVDADTPKPGPNDVLAEIRCVGICGTDVGIYDGSHWIVARGPGGHGHETGAIAVEVGKNVVGIEPGDRLARMGAGFAQYSTEVNVLGQGDDEKYGAPPIVRNDLTVEELSFADPVACAINCAERAELGRIQGRTPKAVVLGLGPIGLILTQILRRERGVEVAASEPYEHKRALAESYGATTFNPAAFKRSIHGKRTYVDQIREEFGEADVVFEMVGRNEILVDAIDLVRPGYRVLVFGAQRTQIIPYEKCRRRGVEIVYPQATMNSKDDENYWHVALDLIAKRRLKLLELITHRVSLAEAVEVFEYYKREEYIKVLIEPFRQTEQRYLSVLDKDTIGDLQMNMIGAYGPWMAELASDPPRLSFRNDAESDIEAWRTEARQRALDCLAMPDSGGTPQVTVHAQYIYNGLHVEELSWQLPYGPRTEAILLKPAGSTDPLPGILALHDHATNKYFGKRKIARTSDAWHPTLFESHDPYYGGVSWANELAKRGYTVLVPDAFTFGSRRVRLSDVPEHLRQGVVDTGLDDEPDNGEAIEAYNQWAAEHESVMAKSLFSAGTTWPGVFLDEDQRPLDVLCARDDVNDTKIGCGGLSGGGLRTVYLGGLDPRIDCAVCVGMMTTWRDYLLNVSSTHTWMAYIPGLPLDLDYPEVLGLRVPLPTMVLSNIEDPLFTLPEMARADEMLRRVYEKAGASDRYQGSFHPGGHKFDLPMQAEAFDWFDKWLK